MSDEQLVAFCAHCGVVQVGRVRWRSRSDCEHGYERVVIVHCRDCGGITRIDPDLPLLVELRQTLKPSP